MLSFKKLVPTLCIAISIFVSFPLTAFAESSNKIPEQFRDASFEAMKDYSTNVMVVDYHDVFTANEIEMLKKLTMAEAGNQSEKCQMMVAAAVLNRIGSENFPNDMESVIFQKENGTWQFSCIPDGNYKKANPTAQVEKAVDAALFNYVNEMGIVPNDLLYFNSIGYFSWAEDYTKDGAMYFSLQ